MSGYIDIENMSFSYGDGRNVLDRINLTIRKNDFIAVIGPSGCGKSTFLRLLAGLAQPDSGCLAVEGRPIAGPGLDRAVVFQDYSLYPWFNCRDNIVLALEQAGLGASRANR
ncbi:MAG: ATP-binding cassette domain-containing protein, partial [Candidatus Adiutrix sp.]|nr:ATP-binding cassette domain-containing protein [Candidatus Adiutrix sp.]